MSALFTGPIVIAYAADPMTAPKIAAKFAEKNAKYVVLGGAMGKTALDANNVKALATMPSLDELRATLAGMLKQPATRIASVIVAPAGNIARVLAAHAEKSTKAKQRNPIGPFRAIHGSNLTHVKKRDLSNG